MAKTNGALGRGVFQSLTNTIDTLEAREVYWACAVDISTETAIEMVIPDADDRRALRRAWGLTDPTLTPRSGYVDLRPLGIGAAATLYVAGAEIVWPRPGRADPVFVGPGRHPAWDIVEFALRDAGEIKRRWNDVRDAVTYLNARCATLAQMRFHMAALPALLCADPATKGVGDRITEFRVPSSVPRIPDRIRTICRDCTERVAAALLYPDVPSEQRPVRLQVS